MTSLYIAEALGAMASSHLLFSGGGIANACLARSRETPSEMPHPVDSASTAAATRLVSSLYRGDGLVDPELVTSDVTFTDPAACCAGKSEVAEAFRALTFCKPESITEPSIVSPLSQDGRLSFNLHQRYFAGPIFKQGLEVRSTLVVRVAPDGRVRELEERWNGEPLLWWAPFRWTRRFNGMLSGLLTPLALR